MKKRRNILLIGFLILAFNAFNQDLRLLDTKSLIDISKNHGLDSALNLTSNIPIYIIDKITTQRLIEHTLVNRPSSRIEDFLVDYALHFHNSEISEILHDYFERKRGEIENYEPDYFNSLPRISQDALVALIENNSKKTDSLLIKYYQDWKVKSAAYEADYLKGLVETNERKKEKLMSPFEDCNYNCYNVLLALDRLKSKFANKKKLDYHQKKLKDYWQSGFPLSKTGDFTNYNENNIFKTIKLTNHYETLGDIAFNEEQQLKELTKLYNEYYCWKFIMYNEKIGYLDLGCQSGPLAGNGVLYRLELKDNILILYRLKTWIS